MAQDEADHRLHAIAISDEVEDASRRIARTWAITAVLLFVVLAFTVGIPQGPDAEPWEETIQLATLGLLTAGVLLAWRREGLGGAVMLVGSVALWGLGALQHQPLAALLPAVLFMVPSVAFLVAWNRTKSTASLIALGTAVIMVLITGGALANHVHHRGYGSAHPESNLPPLPETPVVWVWTGAVTDTSATVVARLREATDATLAVGTTAADTEVVAGSNLDDVWRFELDGLLPGTEYRYNVAVDGVEVSERTGVFSTFPTGPASFTIAAASCARLGSNGAVYEAIIAADPDLFIATGDLFYADYAETADHFTHAYESSLTQPAQAAMFSAIPIAYVWDDHDYGRNNSDSTSPTRQIALDAYAKNVPHYSLAASDAIYQSFTVGRVQFILLDDRTHRDPGSDLDGPEKSILGNDQLNWLQETLLQAQDAAALTIVVNQVPWISEPAPGADHWGGYTFERQLIADFLADNDIDNILMLSGDAHMVAIDDGSNTDYSTTGNASFPLLQAAALDRPGSVKGGPYSEGAFPGGGQFGFIEVIDTGGSTIEVRLSGLNWAGETRVEYVFTVDTS